ncbi:MAG: hypothetical protein CM15mP106_7910 [Candidatus Neomarinimicrobiota bacterium]|nr:MAG: hypothetical protein CM15mP106_7910 [Candidatus Neomarinimicrobiota bacterium]
MTLFFIQKENKFNFNIGHKQVPRVVGDLSSKIKCKRNDLVSFGYLYSKRKWHISEQAIDYLYLGKKSLDFENRERQRGYRFKKNGIMIFRGALLGKPKKILFR